MRDDDLGRIIFAFLLEIPRFRIEQGLMDTEFLLGDANYDRDDRSEDKPRRC